MNKPSGLKHILFFLLILVILAGIGVGFIYSRVVLTSDRELENNQSEKTNNPEVNLLDSLAEELSNISAPVVRSLDVIKNSSQVVLSNKPLEIVSVDSGEITETNITKDEVILWTNIERTNLNLSVLKTDETLNLIAQKKLNDLFARNYFAHLAPDGKDIGDLATALGYEYAVIGENLALGNFTDGVALVTAWMNSPGHRDNILKPTFTHIGVAVGLGDYGGRRTFMAVQVFAKPLAICRLPDVALKEQIKNNKIDIASLYQQINSEKGKIEGEQYVSEVAYKEAINQHQDLINDYNNLLRVTEASVAAYNKEVKEYNTCLSY